MLSHTESADLVLIKGPRTLIMDSFPGVGPNLFQLLPVLDYWEVHG